jgi:glutathione S-transferase
MSIQLFYSPGTASMVVHQTLIELGFSHELSLIDMKNRDHKSEQYLKLNPNGQVPCLVIDGTAMFESAAMILLLADRAQKLAPKPDSAARQPFLAWLFHLSNTIQPMFRNWFMPHDLAGESHAEVIKGGARIKLEAEFDKLNRHLSDHGPFVAGADFSVADLLAVMLARWSRNMPKPATEWPAIKSLVDFVRARPSWSLMYDREGLTEWLK